jgi:protein gp37
MGKTTIEWTDASWNPIVGCTEISPGCANCYAARLAGTRLKNHPDYNGLVDKRRGEHRWLGKVRFLHERLEEPLRWRKPRRIFVCDMGDLFHELVPDEQIVEVFKTIALGGGMGHTFQVLTKRAKRMRDFMRADHGVEWVRPMPWLWLGVSVENQHFADERIPLLLETPAAIRWISVEPLLGPVDLTSLGPDGTEYAGLNTLIGEQPCCHDHPEAMIYGSSIDWVVVGGESGPCARVMHPDWTRSLHDQCKAAGVPFFFKQWGEWAPLGQIDSSRTFVGRNLGDGQMMLRYGKKLSGRMLDGREWNEFPREAAKNG